MMGSPPTEPERFKNETLHEVTLTKGFYMGATHVTVDQFAAFIQDSGYRTRAEEDGWSSVLDDSGVHKANGISWRNPGFAQKGDHPVVHMTWADAKAMCEWLSGRQGKACHLPTEAQWEYACRAGTQTADCWGDNPDDGNGWCNAADQTLRNKLASAGICFRWSDGFVYTSPAATFKPNPWGLDDMPGNAWQWCADWMGDYPAGSVTDPTGPAIGTKRILRGGGWSFGPVECRSAYRHDAAPSFRMSTFGFRVCMEP